METAISLPLLLTPSVEQEIKVSVMSFELGKVETLTLVRCHPELLLEKPLPGLIPHKITDWFCPGPGLYYCPATSGKEFTQVVFHIYEFVGELQADMLVHFLETMTWLSTPWLTMVSVYQNKLICQQLIRDLPLRLAQQPKMAEYVGSIEHR